MSWLFSQALVAAYSAATCSDGAPSAQLNVMPTPQPFWRNDKTMEPSDLSRFGPTCVLLTEGHGLALLTSFRADFPVRTSAQPARELGSLEPAPASGGRWPASLARFDPATSSWRTAQCSLLGDSESFSETWPRWGSMRSGALYLRPTPVLRTSGSESGLWQTPVADDAVERKAGKWNSRGEPKLSAEVKLWPTPTASLGTNGGRVSPTKAREGGTLIEALSARTRWPTPTAMTNSGGPSLSKWGGSGARAKLRTMVTPEELNGQLNPTWVEWLMGWPTGWTDSRPLEMDRFREWSNSHGTCSPDDGRLFHTTIRG